MLVRDHITQEIKIIGQQPWLKAMLFWLPLTMFFALWWVFASGTARDLPIGVVDFEQSSLSRGLIRYYDVSPTLAVTQSFTSVQKGSEALKSGNIYALVVIPKGLNKDVLLGHPPTVTTFYNSQFILIGKLVNAAMQQAQGTYNAQISAVKNMSHGNVPPQQALAQAVPIQTQITALFNSNSHYGQFLVSAAIPALWQIFIVATTVLSFAVEQRRKGVIDWLGEHPTQSILIKLLPYTILFLAQGLVFLWAMYGWLEWPMHGSWGILLLGQFLMVLACQSVGALFFMLTQDATRSMSFVAAFTAPAFAFMGITFPSTDMPMLAQIWRNLLPVSHYIDVQVKQVNNGIGLDQASGQLLVLALFSSLLIVVIFKARALTNGTQRGQA
ncbi:ABC transporter permease [Vibrio rumoiensis]|uniref:Multidrug ABC transporter permease n=1 Tax=Vibrio rumoiensis 1S-45 TaxID=1188252 RepID=A0A1E5E5R7_9VIBR|nr:ABC transporter permease [Vibrio rumoiensis]OEF29379.1 multidrug ABC transporter permease [Vibrio rumoiensis 1S-45]